MMNLLKGFLVVLVVFSCFSCSDKNYDSDLRGKWQVKFEERSGVKHKVDTIFYNFDNNVLSIQSITSPTILMTAFGYFSQNGDSLDLEIVDPDSQNYIINNVCFGWINIGVERKFRIEHLNSKSLIIKDGYSELSLSKF